MKYHIVLRGVSGWLNNVFLPKIFNLHAIAFLKFLFNTVYFITLGVSKDFYDWNLHMYVEHRIYINIQWIYLKLPHFWCRNGESYLIGWWVSLWQIWIECFWCKNLWPRRLIVWFPFKNGSYLGNCEELRAKFL